MYQCIVSQYLTPFKDSWPEFIHVHRYLSNYILPACVWCSKLSSLSSWSAAAKGKRSFKRVMAMLCIVEGWSAMITTCCNVDDLLNSTVRLQSLVLSNYKVSSGVELSKACSGMHFWLGCAMLELLVAWLHWCYMQQQQIEVSPSEACVVTCTAKLKCCVLCRCPLSLFKSWETCPSFTIALLHMWPSESLPKMKQTKSRMVAWCKETAR